MDVTHPSILEWLTDFLWTYVLLIVLVGAGIYFTIRTRFVQFRRFPSMLSTLFSSRSGAEGGVSSFQAFAIGLSSRVGTGNITGVAIALTLGGPGSVFWMWIVALFGMATAFVEATLAQVFKTPGPTGTFIGGPAYYIQRGLGSRRWGIVFAVLLLLTFGVAFSMVQANTIADVLGETGRFTKLGIAGGIVVLLAPVLFGGIKRVAKVAELVIPFMAGFYILLALTIIFMNLGQLGGVLRMIFESAFGARQAMAGIGGGMIAAVLNGAKRGLFSNEAGMGSAPNTAATATTPHPVNQGFVQSLGVFVDTMMVCTATAFVILLGEVYVPGETGEAAGASLTLSSMTGELGTWVEPAMTIIISAFAFTSLMGNYAYSEVNVDFLGGRKKARFALRMLILLSALVGSVVALESVWLFADLTMGLMALVNLVALALLARWAIGALKDWERQRRTVRAPVFAADSPDLPGHLDPIAWSSSTEAPDGTHSDKA